jgi:ribosomal protein S18 acetylase RimI-like enzyme
VELTQLYLDRPWHGRGVADLVLARLADLALDLGARLVRLGVWEHNGRAIAFYEKHGFTQVGVQEFRLGGELHNDHVMVAEVSAIADSDTGWDVATGRSPATA